MILSKLLILYFKHSKKYHAYIKELVSTMQSIINIYEKDNIIGGGFLIDKYLVLTKYSLVKDKIDMLRFIFVNDIGENYYMGDIVNYVINDDEDWAVIKLNKDVNNIKPMEIDENFNVHDVVMCHDNIFWIIGCNKNLHPGYPIVDEMTGKVVGMIMEMEGEQRVKAMKLTYVRWSKDHYASMGLGCRGRRKIQQ